MDPSAAIKNQQMDSKRMKTGKEKILIDKTKEGMGKMIELEYISSDEGFWAFWKQSLWTKIL